MSVIIEPQLHKKILEAVEYQTAFKGKFNAFPYQGDFQSIVNNTLAISRQPMGYLGTSSISLGTQVSNPPFSPLLTSTQKVKKDETASLSVGNLLEYFDYYQPKTIQKNEDLGKNIGQTTSTPFLFIALTSSGNYLTMFWQSGLNVRIVQRDFSLERFLESGKYDPSTYYLLIRVYSV